MKPAERTIIGRMAQTDGKWISLKTGGYDWEEAKGQKEASVFTMLEEEQKRSKQWTLQEQHLYTLNDYMEMWRGKA